MGPDGRPGGTRSRSLLRLTWHLMPGLGALRHYERDWLRADVLAGVTVAAYLVPQVMAYAEVADLPAVVGLWAVIGSLLVYVPAA
jgi:SulP family sulfate permease